MVRDVLLCSADLIVLLEPSQPVQERSYEALHWIGFEIVAIHGIKVQ